MADREKVIKGLELCRYDPDPGQENKWYHSCLKCPYCWSGPETEMFTTRDCWRLFSDALALLKEQEARELTIDEWREWKVNPKRDPICKLWENDTSPMWIINPNDVHEPALLMGKLKLFTGKPTFEQCKAVKWND